MSEIIEKSELVKFYENGIEVIDLCYDDPDYRDGLRVILECLRDKFKLKEAS